MFTSLILFENKNMFLQMIHYYFKFNRNLFTKDEFIIR